MAEKFEETAIIIRQEEIADDIYSMWLHTDQIAAHAKAGQFVSVYCNDGSRLLPRPISICEIDKKDGAIRLVYRVAGKSRIFWHAYRRTASHCRASWKWIPKEREKSLFDRRRNRNTSNVTACKRVKL
jgi:ferredoxin-NADP reductase